MIGRLLIHRFFHFFVLFTLLLLSIWFSTSTHPLREKLRYTVFDQFNKMYERERTDDVIIVDIDELSLLKQGQWPWPRHAVGKLIERLTQSGAKVIAFDMVFAEEDRTSPALIAKDLPEEVREKLSVLPSNEERMAQSIRISKKVVTGFVGAGRHETLRQPHISKKIFFHKELSQDDKEALYSNVLSPEGVSTNLPVLSKNAAGNGSFILKPSDDGIARFVPILVGFPKHTSEEGQKPELYPALSLEAFRVSLSRYKQLYIRRKEEIGTFDFPYYIAFGMKGSEYEVPIDRSASFYVHYRSTTDQDYISAYKFLGDNVRDEDAARIKDKIVLVGTSAEGLKDIRSTPLSVFVPGVEVHLNVIEQILQGDYLLRPDFMNGVEALFIFVMGMLVITLTSFVGAVSLALICLISIELIFWGAWMAYTEYGILFDPTYPALSVILLFFVATFLTYIRSEFDRKQIKQAFGLYISPAFMKELTENPDKLALGGEVKDISVMFTDIRSFTTISESLSPEELIQLMNDFLTPMSDLVMENRGTIDKYMGDAMMAFWNAPLDDKDHAKNACRAALEMNKALAPINEARMRKAKEEGHDVLPLKAGIGINTGLASVGNMGSKQRFAYSALGDTVNLASRLEGQTKTYGVNILIGEDTKNGAQDFATLELDLLRVKGKFEPVRIFALVGDEQIAKEEAFVALKAKHEEMLAAYRSADFGTALDLLETCQSMDADHVYAGQFYAMFQERIQAMRAQPTEKEWDGVYIATTK